MTEARFHSQYQQDKVIYETFFRNKKDGIFLEIGADDGVDKSNSLFFERSLGWWGMCIEPRPNAFKKLIKNRSCVCENVALSNTKGTGEFLSIHGWGKGLSGLTQNYDQRHKIRIKNELLSQQGQDSSTEIIQVRVVKLSELLEKHGFTEIDYCSLDTEGSEFDILRSIDFDNFRFNVMSIENNYADNQIREFLINKGFKFCGRIVVDDIFINPVFIEEQRNFHQNAMIKKNGFGQGKAIPSIEIARKIRPNIITLIDPHNKYIQKVHPYQLLTSNRFDLIAKYIYAKHRELNIDSQWALRLYTEHLRVLNGFVEPDGTGKSGIETFAEAFHSILKSIRTDGFDDGVSLIPIGRKNIILDGSHRVAAGLLYNKELTGLFCDIPAYVYDHQFFSNYTKHVKTGLGAPWTDAMALEYCKLKQNIHIVTVFPSANGQENQIQKILQENGDIVYSKAVNLIGQGPVLLMRQMYSGEKWIGSWNNNFQGARQKAALCFTRSGPVRVYVLETDQIHRVNEAKRQIRDLFKIENHSIHINDTHAETVRLAQVFFNTNSIHFLNHALPKRYGQFNLLFDYYSNWLCNQLADKECFCIDGSAVMAAYGIREARDMDFLFFGNDDLVTGHKLVSCHNHEVHHYTTSRDDIIFNPENHFYFNGLKFASMNMVRSMKAKRAEDKDDRDLTLIDDFLYLKNASADRRKRPLTFQSEKDKTQTGIDHPTLINYVYAHTRANGFAMHKDNTTIVWSQAPIENCDLYAFQDAFSFTGRQPGINVLLMQEPVVVLPGQYDEQVFDHFDYVLTSLDSLAEKSSKIKKIRHSVFDGPLDQKTLKRIDTGYRVPLEEKENAICMISGNKASHVPGELYSKRVEIAAWFHANAGMRFDVYGRPPFPQLPNYLGELNPHAQKFVTLARYRYSLCFENVYDPFWSKGYLTEKLPHCLMCGTVPIYMGCANIEEYVPPECFIDYRRFQDTGELAAFLEGLSDANYRTYLDNVDAWVRAGNLESFSFHHAYDQLTLLASPELKPAEVTSGAWQTGPAPEFDGSQLKVVAAPPLWSWTDLASKTPSPELLFGNFTLTDNPPAAGSKGAGSKEPIPGPAMLPRQDTQTEDLENVACDVQAGYQEFVVGQASGSSPASLTRQDRDWCHGEWRMRPVQNPYGLVEINGVQGFLGQGDVSHLYKKAKSLPQNGVIVEIGSFMGLSAIVMGCGLRDSGNYSTRIYCVDSWDSRYLEKVEVSDTRELYDIFMENVVRAGLQSFICPIRKRSMEAVADFAVHSVDLLFIDGDHSFESCYADLTSWYQKVRPGGIIVGHDCRPGQGVHKAVEKFKSECSQDYLLIPPPETNYMFELKIRDVPVNPIEDMISDKKLYDNAAEVNKEQLVSIIILNFNGAAHIQKCIESIKAHTDEPYELIVVDNASTDNSLAYLRTLKEISLVENPENLGCPPARTQAMALARGEYVLLLDNDTIVTPGWLTTFCGHARRNPAIGLFGPCSNHVSGPQKVDEVPYEDVQGLEAFARTFSDRNRGRLTIVPRLVGFCMFIRRAVIDRIGAPDPRFGKFGFEDDDYTWRAIIAGFQAAIAQNIFIHHSGGPQMQGDTQYNQYIRDAWDIFKAKWDLPTDLEYGTPFDVADYLAQPFDMDKHFIPVPDKSSIEKLITTTGDRSTAGLPSGLQQDLEQRLDTGEQQFAAGNSKAAEEIFTGILVDYPGQAQAHNNLGVLYYGNGDKEKTLHHYQQAVRLNPKNIIFQKNLADFYSVVLGRIEDALRIYVKVLAAQPRDTETLLVTGHICVALHRFDDAKVFYDRVLEIDPGNMDAKQNLDKIVSSHPDQGDIEVDEENYNNFQQDEEQGIPSQKIYIRASIIIPASGNQKYIKRCVESIKMHTPQPYEVVFINNGATKRTSKWLKRCMNENSNYYMVKCPKDANFARLYNEGIKASTGDTIVIMHDDVMLSPGWFEDMNRSLNSDEHVGVVGPMTNAALGIQKDSRADYEDMDRFDDYAKKFRDTNQYRRTSVRTISDCCIMFRRALAEKIGLFDESFETLGVMVEDFCIRSALEGFKNIIASDVFVHHFDLHPSGPGNAEKDRKAFDAKWRGIDAGTSMGKKLYVMNLIDAADELSQKGKIDDAVKMLIDGIGQYPSEKRIYHALSQTLINAGRFKEAHEVLETIPGAKKADADGNEVCATAGVPDIYGLILAGSCLEDMNRYEEAGLYADRALALKDAFAPALNLKGILAYREGDLDTAEVFFCRAIASDPGYGGPHTNLGVLKLAKEQTNEAIDSLEKGFILSPDVNDMATTFHSAATASGDFSKAENRFVDAVALNLHNRNLRHLLIDLFLQQGKHELALNEIEKLMISFGMDDGLISAALEIREKIGPMEIPPRSENRQTLSLCMIVKDEKEYLPRCLGSIKTVVDEMIIVDTGSTDRTRDIAIIFGAMVFDFAWNGDFSEARNFSLSKAGGDWIFVLDADEVLSPIDYSELKNLTTRAERVPVAYSITTRNYVHPINVPGWVGNDGKYREEEAGNGWYPSPKIRLFTNDPRMRFEGRVHELIEPSLKKIGISPTPCSVPIHHYGKLIDAKNISKGEEYYLLGEKKLEEGDGDIDSLTELAKQAAELKRHDEAIELWQQVIGLKSDMPVAYLNMCTAYMALGDYKAGLEASKKALHLDPGLKEAALNYSTCALCAGDPKNAILILETLLQHVPDHPVAMALLSGGYCIVKDKEKAFNIINRIKEMGFECANYIVDLAERLVSSKKFNSAILLLEAAVESGNSTREIRELLDSLLIG